MKAKIRDTEIYFDVAGMQLAPGKNTLIEKPVLFLIHGGPGGNHVHFKFDSLKLQDYAQLIFIDQRGCGLSKKSKKADYTLENNIEDIEALRKYLGLDKICVLGISYGGMVAQGYAIRYPKAVEKLILVATAPSYHFLQDAKDHLQQFATPKQIAICEKYLWSGAFSSHKEVKQYFKTMDSLYIQSNKKRRQLKLHGTYSKVLVQPLAIDVLNAGFGGFLRHFNFIPKLKKITCPTLILSGSCDWICTTNQSRCIAANIPQAKLKVFKNCGHSITTDANDKYIKEIKAFLKQ